YQLRLNSCSLTSAQTRIALWPDPGFYNDPARVGMIMQRRRATWQTTDEEDNPIPAPVRLWQQAVHDPGIYNLEVDTSLLSSEECAALIQQRRHDGPPPATFSYLASLIPEHNCILT